MQTNRRPADLWNRGSISAGLMFSFYQSGCQSCWGRGWWRCWGTTGSEWWCRTEPDSLACGSGEDTEHYHRGREKTVLQREEIGCLWAAYGPQWRLINAMADQKVSGRDKRISDRMGGKKKAIGGCRGWEEIRERLYCTRARPAGETMEWL